LAEISRQTTDITNLKADLAAALQQAATARQERDGAKATATTEQAAVVTGLKADLAAALQQAATARQERDGAKATTATTATELAQLKQQKEKEMATQAQHDLLAAATARRAENPQYRPTQEELRAVDAVLIEKTRERLGIPEPVHSTSNAPGAAGALEPVQMQAPVPEPVWPKLSEQAFKELNTGKIAESTLQACFDVLVMCMSVAAAAAKHQIFKNQITRALEKLLGNYVAPEPPAQKPAVPEPAPTPAPAPAKAPERRGGVGR
jgi:hypothetical protein